MPLHAFIQADSEAVLMRGVQRVEEEIARAVAATEKGVEIVEHDYGSRIELEIPNSQLGVVIGKNGAGLQRIMDMSGCQVVVQSGTVQGKPLMKLITIDGDPMKCKIARDEVVRTVHELVEYVCVCVFFVLCCVVVCARDAERERQRERERERERERKRRTDKD